MWILRLFAWMHNWAFPVPKIIPFENLYPLGMNKDRISETDENIVHKRAEELTPSGTVKMTYDESSNTFFYWAEKSIEYKYLEVVARKYVILYDCKELYVNMFKELIIAMNKPASVSITGPYVSLKPYNTVHHKLSNKKIVNEKSNQYKRIGKWNETIIVIPYKPISFLEYKRIHG